MQTSRSRQRNRRKAVGVGVAATLLPGLATAGVLLAGTPDTSHAAPPGQDREFDVEVLSGRADMTTGGDALVGIDVPRNVPPHQVRVNLDGEDVSELFRPGDDPRTLLGVVDGLEPGDNVLDVRANGRGHGRPSATVTLSGHRATGPVFSGQHIQLYCTADGPPWNLGPVDENCHVESPTVSYEYRTTGGDWAALPDGPLPDDVATATTTDGETVPYVVRVERGTINRAVYEIAVLHEPGTALPDPWTPAPGWNDRLVYTFGGGCGIGHTQGAGTGGVLDDTLLGQGYAVASSTFNVYQSNCNDVTSAETAMMVKEHFAETYGAPEFTMGWGSSAGTMQQLLMSNAYPGILDGVIGHIGYPDERTTTVSGHECRFITGAIDDSELDWTDEQGRAVTGFARFSLSGQFGTSTCAGYMFFDGVDYPASCPGHIPPADRYDPDSNPDGIRCAIADFVSAVYGLDPDTGFGRRVLPDTVGVQYGLEALRDGIISPEQFVDLNERIGGLDAEGNRTAERSSVDVDALERAYATGRVNQFDGGLRWTPIIETRRYTDLQADFHDRHRSWSMRERLLDANGHADNHASWVAPPGELDEQLRRDALAEMDAWLTARQALDEQRPDLDEVAKTRISRPDGLADGCLDPDGEWHEEPLTLDPDAECNELFPIHRNPRIAAGGPTSADVLKCRLTGMDRDDYAVSFTDDQWDRLRAVFPDGVCDWSRPGVGQVPLEDTWLSYDGGPQP
ncbi:MAG: DUF6351 family protein [Actinomycetota bacterium]